METLNLVSLIVGILLGLGGLTYGIRAIFRFTNRLVEAVGADKNGRTISERLDRIEHQLWPNGGSSLADKVNHLTVESAETISDIRFIKKILLSNFHVDFPQEEEIKPEPVKRTRKSKIQKVL